MVAISLGASAMAALAAAPPPHGRRSFAATATKSAGGEGKNGGKQEKGLLDWILGGLQKEDQLLETDPILNKVDEKTNGGRKSTTTTTVSVPDKNKKKPGFGGLFAKS